MDLKRYFGTRAFYKTVLTVAMPIMLQNLITNFVSMLDNIMVGALGTEQMSGVSIVNQIGFIYILAMFGGMSGVGIFTAQFYGKKDAQGVAYTVRFKLIVALLTCFAGGLVMFLFDDQLISLFLHESGSEGDIALTLEFAKTYLRHYLVGLLPIALVQAYAGTLRETGNTFVPMAAGMAAVGTNCLFNYLLIFGKFGLPALGVTGAAVATNIARVLEMSILLIYIIVKRERHPWFFSREGKLPGDLVRSMVLKGSPLLVNELLWSSGMSALSVAFSLHGLDVVAAYSISSTVTNLFGVSFMAMGVSIGIIVGQNLGAGEYRTATENVRKLYMFTTLLSIGVGIVMFACGHVVTRFYNTTDTVKDLAAYLIRVYAFVMPLHALTNASYFTLRSGGKTMITFLFDSGSVWLLMVPTAFALFYFAHLDIHALYPAVMGLEILKVILGLVLVKKKVWMRTIV